MSGHYRSGHGCKSGRDSAAVQVSAVWGVVGVDCDASCCGGVNVMRNLQGVTVTSKAIASLCQTAVPESAKFLHAYFDGERNAFVCVFEDESFESVPEGCRFPIDVSNQIRSTDPLSDYSQTAWHEIPVSEISPEAFGFLGD